MASIRKRGNAWQARVTRRGFPEESGTFKTKAEAERWSRSTEAAMDAGTFSSSRPAQDVLLGDLLARYRQTVTPMKKGAVEEGFRLKSIERSRMARLSLANVTAQVIAEYRDARLATCKPDTVIRDLAVLSSIFNHARKEWGYTFTNPVPLVRKPQASPGRSRVVSCDEERRLLLHAVPSGRRNALMRPVLLMALETAMRKGELLALRWEHVDLDRRVVFLPTTKNGRSRSVPLSTRALETLSTLDRSHPLVFPWKAAALNKAFERLCWRAGIEELRFHDLRHTATTRLAERLPNVIELAAVTGHLSLQVLKRYYHPTAESLALKLG
jgi:integrase